MSSTYRPSVSVIVAIHKGGGNFRCCLLSRTAINPGLDEIIMVADGERDGSWRLA